MQVETEAAKAMIVVITELNEEGKRTANGAEHTNVK